MMKKEAVFLLGMVMIILGTSIGAARILEIIRCSETAHATIINVVEEDSSSSGAKVKNIKYYPTITFTVGDKIVRETLDTGSRDAGRYTDGETLTVKYDPGNPNTFFAEGIGNYTKPVASAVFIIAGILMIIVGIKIARRSEGLPVFRP